MKIAHNTSYNIIFDDMKDIASGSLAHLFAKVLFEYNLTKGLEQGEPFLAEMGVVVTNYETPNPRMIVISLNKSNVNSTDIELTENIPYIIQFILTHNHGMASDIRRVKALCKGFKKTQSYRKYLNCFYILVSELSEEKADAHIKDLMSYGLPFYVKVKKVIGLLVNLTRTNVKTLLYFRGVWGEDTFKHIYLYLTGDNPIPDYITNDYKEDMQSSMFQINLINFGVAIGKGELNKFLLKILVEEDS